MRVCAKVTGSCHTGCMALAIMIIAEKTEVKQIIKV